MLAVGGEAPRRVDLCAGEHVDGLGLDFIVPALLEGDDLGGEHRLGRGREVAQEAPADRVAALWRASLARVRAASPPCRGGSEDCGRTWRAQFARRVARLAASWSIRGLLYQFY